MLSPIRLSSVCLSVTFVHRPTQPVEFLAICLRHLVPWPYVDIREFFCGNRPTETPTLGAGGVKRKRGSQI